MDGEPTRQLMYTMFHALKFIPSRATFNIVSFGSTHEFLFPESVAPTFENLYTARKRILVSLSFLSLSLSLSSSLSLALYLFTLNKFDLSVISKLPELGGTVLLRYVSAWKER